MKIKLQDVRRKILIRSTEEKEKNQKNEYEIKGKVTRASEKVTYRKDKEDLMYIYLTSLRRKMKQLDRERFIAITQGKFLESQDNLSLHI